MAVAVGNPGPNRFYPNAVLDPHADAQGTGSTAIALGDGSQAGSLGNGNHAFVLGQGSNAFSYGGNAGNPLQPFAGNHNTSIAVGNGSEAGAVGNHRLSTAFGDHRQRQNNGLGELMKKLIVGGLASRSA